MTKEDILKQEINNLQGRVARQAVRMARIRRVTDAVRDSKLDPVEGIWDIIGILKEERAEEAA